MLQKPRSADLLYVANGKKGVLVLSYPSGKIVGHLVGLEASGGLCSDANGDVFVTEPRLGQIVEYAHGGTSPINTLSLQGQPNDCSSDATTGDLAVAEANSNAIAIFRGAQGTPQFYTDLDFEYLRYCAYDSQGDLFIDGPINGSTGGLTELRAGSTTFTNITLNKDISPFGDLQWHGKYLALQGGFGLPLKVYRIQISGSNGQIVRTTTLKGVRRIGFTWIQESYIVASIYGPSGARRHIGFWPYPSGGNLVKMISPGKPLYGVTVSVAPSR